MNGMNPMMMNMMNNMKMNPMMMNQMNQMMMMNMMNMNPIMSQMMNNMTNMNQMQMMSQMKAMMNNNNNNTNMNMNQMNSMPNNQQMAMNMNMNQPQQHQHNGNVPPNFNNLNQMDSQNSDNCLCDDHTITNNNNNNGHSIHPMHPNNNNNTSSYQQRQDRNNMNNKHQYHQLQQQQNQYQNRTTDQSFIPDLSSIQSVPPSLDKSDDQFISATVTSRCNSIDGILSDEDDDLSTPRNIATNRKRRKSVSHSNNILNDNYEYNCLRGTGKRGLDNYTLNDDSALSQDYNDQDMAQYGEYGVDGEYYPEVGVRATTTIELSKDLFVGHNDMHLKIAQDMLLRAIKRIAEFRW
eukprot:CAMPEP_0201594726 /NCGR_PEP_ID=MMETSP0190_2-20130828/191951_1 /ASSEMBLY_ACC=CAM_ASM_000263 /TAXON_ID=37353 /ORGANISM="Rosalina sp." /LENGTH=350 /DNA_ID=CAMNT_0048054443 /DNA_START=1666 /DNA_END=2715 /DNA_ORIENTATION=+